MPGAVTVASPVLTKRQSYHLWRSGAYGNKLRAWRTVAEWRSDGCPGTVSLRTLGAGGGPCRYDVAPADVDGVVASWVVAGLTSPDLVMVNESAPDEHVVLQGEFLNDVRGDGRPAATWGYFLHSRAKMKMRDALRREPEEASGLVADIALRGAMTPSSYEDWRVLLDSYPGHVLEVSVYDRCLGDVPWRNAIVWEVRTY